MQEQVQVSENLIFTGIQIVSLHAGFLSSRGRIKENMMEFVFQNTLTDRYKYIAVTSQRSGQPGVNAQEYAEFKIEVPQKGRTDQNQNIFP